MKFTELKAITEKHNITVGRFADLIGTTTSSIRKYCSNADNIQQRTIDKIEHGLKVLEASNMEWPKLNNPYDYYSLMVWRELTAKYNNKFRKLL